MEDIEKGLEKKKGSVMVSRKYLGWGIKMFTRDWTNLAGVLFWTAPPLHMDAMRTAVFNTRKTARDGQRVFQGTKTRMVRVRVTIQEI